MTPAQRRELTDRQHRSLSIVRQCQLMGVSRSSLYYRPKGTPLGDLSLMQAMDRQYLETPFYGSRRMKASLDRQGLPVSRKRVQRLMRLMGLRAIYRQPRTSQPAAGRWVYPYLLRDLTITRANQVWAADITTCPWPGDSCTWSQSWTGTAGTWWLGGCPTLWRPAFVPRP